MKKIMIDDDVFAFLQSQAIPFVEQPNDTLRRILGISDGGESYKKDSVKFEQFQKGDGKHRKGPRTDLKLLVQEGFLNEEQELFMHDYKGNILTGKVAIVSDGKLLYNGELYSMSELARKLLHDEGFEPTHVRGPSFWKNEEGISVKRLWRIYLSKQKGV